MLSTRYSVGSLLGAGACNSTPNLSELSPKRTASETGIGGGGITDKICLSIAAQILAAADLFSAANIVSILMWVLEAQVKSVLKESAYCRTSSLSSIFGRAASQRANGNPRTQSASPSLANQRRQHHTVSSGRNRHEAGKLQQNHKLAHEQAWPRVRDAQCASRHSCSSLAVENRVFPKRCTWHAFQASCRLSPPLFPGIM